MAWKAPSKKNFFEDLERLDHSEESDDCGDDSLEHVASLKPVNVAKSATSHVPILPDPPQSTTLTRACAEPELSAGQKEVKPDQAKKIETKHPRRSEQHSTIGLKPVQRFHTTGSMSSMSSAGPASKKRKPNNTKIISEDQQIFKGLVFFFFPNNDISPARRLRIQRAREYGAQWARQFSTDVTHVIMDKGLQYQELLKHLKLESFPESITLVNETYPSDCIRFRSVLSPSYERFRVDGAPSAAENTKPTTPTRIEPEPKESSPVKKSTREQLPNLEPPRVPVDEGASTPLPVIPAVQTDASGPARERDALDDIIDETKATSHLPLDFESEVEESDAGSGDDSENEHSGSLESDRPRKVPKGHEKEHRGESWIANFACMQDFNPDARQNNPNSKTIEILEQMAKYYERMGDNWRNLAYRKGITALRRQTDKIVTREQARSIPGIGERLADKIEEIVLTSHLRQLDNTNSSADDHVLQLFMGIYGVGLSQASKWLAQGYRTLEDLVEKAHLNANQRVGIEHYHDFMQRIPRKEVEAHGLIVQKAVQAVDPNMQVIVAGSYRRGALDTGDVDVLITKPDATLSQIRTLMNEVVIPQLEQDGFLKVALVTSRRYDSDGSKWHGASALPGSSIWRRIDLLFVPGEEFGAAILYFTGNDIFNRSMRLLAHKKGLSLNQHGLFSDVLRDRQRQKVNPGRLLESRDERRIFALLGVPWRPPEHRIC